MVELKEAILGLLLTDLLVLEIGELL